MNAAVTHNKIECQGSGNLLLLGNAIFVGERMPEHEDDSATAVMRDYVGLGVDDLGEMYLIRVSALFDNTERRELTIKINPARFSVISSASVG